MYFEFYLDDLQIKQPQGFADIILNMKRDDNWHGIFFEASTSSLQFFGEAADYLRNKKDTDGLRANVVFKALQSCGIYEDLETILEGNLDFRRYEETCGTTCSVTIPVEQTGCLMTLRNRYDQKVDMDSSVAFDKLTAIQQYDKLNFEMDIPARELDARVEGDVPQDGNDTDFSYELLDGETIVTFRPSYDDEVFNSIQTGQLIPNSAEGIYDKTRDTTYIDLSPQLLFQDNLSCFDGDLNYSFRLKGSYTAQATDTLLQTLKLKIVTWNGVGDIFTDGTVISETTLASAVDLQPGTSGSFDQTYSGVETAQEGVGYYGYIEFNVLSASAPNTLTINIVFDTESNVNINTVKSCPTTQANVYAVNESLSHVAEAITDGCLKVKSDYYGRTDSQPYTSTEDGCGGLRILTSGLKIRKAETPKFFASLKDLFDGLKGIDNIGMGIETNTFLPNAQWLRVEPVEYFYTDEEILSLPFVPEAKLSIQEQLHYSIAKTGYKNWEVENVNGLDEFCSTKEYRTGLSSVNNTIDIISELVAAGYAWEITRQQSFADTGAADTKFDNNIFIACVERDAYGFHIEQNNIEDAANIFSPETAYNWRIRPYYNLMRWFKSIANSYANIIDTNNKLFFSSGTGNLTAIGEIAGAYPTCKLENSEKAENRDLHRTDFADETEATPIWKPEYMTLRYPLSVRDYNTLKANPYGYISVQCGTGGYIKGYVQEAKYRLVKGEVDLTLKIKYGS